MTSTTSAGRPDGSGRGSAAPVEADETVVDGRNRRWEKHRARRRTELVDATLRAIRRHGASVGMDDIAAVAGTSKTVFYRHFTDRAGLYDAVAERVNSNIIGDVAGAVGNVDEVVAFAEGPDTDAAWSPRQLLASAIDAYLRLVEDDPEVYRFIVNAPLVPLSERTDTGDAASGVSQSVGRQVGVLITTALQATGKDTTPGATWGHAVVGMVRAAADEWLREGAESSGTSRETLREHLTKLIWGGLSATWPDVDRRPAKEVLE
ncbi:TetR family transcriptional regulator [Knoellia remsis]|uniref:TetR family transcriptional regulator n=1 Tax=Knoellia remsis TaxID=407159 RepID=UPI000D05C2AB|nr:TetR family transcriptional regulator [Knoellia remsis]